MKNIVDFSKEIGVEIEIKERDSRRLPKYYVKFQSCDVKDGIMLRGEHGNGNTISAAIKDYCIKISNKNLVFNAMNPEKRREIKAPSLFYKTTEPVKQCDTISKEALRNISNYCQKTVDCSKCIIYDLCDDITDLLLQNTNDINFYPADWYEKEIDDIINFIIEEKE